MDSSLGKRAWIHPRKQKNDWKFKWNRGSDALTRNCKCWSLMSRLLNSQYQAFIFLINSHFDRWRRWNDRLTMGILRTWSIINVGNQLRASINYNSLATNVYPSWCLWPSMGQKNGLKFYQFSMRCTLTNGNVSIKSNPIHQFSKLGRFINSGAMVSLEWSQ